MDAQVEPSADINLVWVFGATIDEHLNDFLLDLYKSRVGKGLLCSLGIESERAPDLIHGIK